MESTHEKWLDRFNKYSPIIALFLNLIGALFLIFYAGAYTGEGIGWADLDEQGNRLETIYLINPTMFKIGIWFIVIGFFIQLINELFKFEPILTFLDKILSKKSSKTFLLEKNRNGK